VPNLRLNLTPLLFLSGVVAAVSGGGAALSSSGGRAPSAPPESPRAGAKTETEAAAPTAAGKEPEPVQRDALTTLERFAGIPRTPERDAAGLCTRVTSAVDRVCSLGYQKVHVLLATLPDPLDSRFAKLFDDEVGAIRMALERSGFVDDRFYDPWQRDLSSAEGAHPQRWREPAALIFRRVETEDENGKKLAEDRKELLVLLMVGETPTAGIHRQALRKALDLANAIQAASCDASQAEPFGPLEEAEAASRRARSTLPIVGPAMSGSAESLRLTLTQWFAEQRFRRADAPSCGSGVGPPFDIEFVSGSATSDANREILERQLTKEIDRTFKRFSSTFRATVLPDSVQRDAVIRYLARRLRICRIAFLTEASTSYGEEFADSAKKPTTETCPDGTDLRLVNLPFPLHISKLQNLAFDSTPTKESSSAALQRRLGNLERDDDSSKPDSFPTKSRVTQSASEIALREVLDGISTEDVDAIVIVASSTADVLFLAERIRRSFPNVTVVVNDADIVFLHDDVPFMEGVLAASTYPLSPWTQRLGFPFEGDSNRLLFSSGAAEGTYNATVFLIDQLTTINVLDYGRPFAIPDEDFWPPQWITVISKGAFWPLAAVALGDAGYLQHAEPLPGALSGTHTRTIKHEIWTLPHSFVFLLAGVLLALIDLLTIIAYARARYMPGSEKPSAAPEAQGILAKLRCLFVEPTLTGARTAARAVNLFAQPKIFGPKGMQKFEIASLLLILLLVNAGFLAVGIVTTLPPTSGVTGPWAALTVVFGVITIFVAVLTAYAFLDCLGAEGKVRSLLAIIVGLGVVALAVGLGWSRLAALKAAGTEGPRVAHLMFFIERARNLDSGVSLLWMALLLAAGHAMWNIGHLRQVRIVEDAATLRDRGVISVAPRDAKAVDDDLTLAQPMSAVIEEAEGVLPSRLGAILMGIVFVDALWISRHLTFFESPVLGWISAGAYALLLALIVFGCARYLRTWWALEEVLARVAPLPVVGALRRIPGRLLTSFKRPWDARVFEVWQRHCHEVFVGLPDKEAQLKLWAATLEEKDLATKLLTSPLATQIEWLKKLPAAAASEGEMQWRLKWEEFLAMRLVAFIHYTRTHLANFVGVSTAAILPALWATNFYPLRQNRFLLMLVLAVAGAATLVPAVVFVQMNRNYVLSRLARTRPGRVTWDRGFVSNILVHVAVPLLALLAVKFPELGRWWGAIIGGVAALGGAAG
jgi:hypothetical protein